MLKNPIKSGPDLDENNFRLLNPALLHESYAKLYFDAKHINMGLNKGC